MITDVKISFQYSGDNQWRIDFIRNNEEGSIQHIREIELISMYHCLARDLNKNHKCNFNYLESEITRCHNHPTYGKGSCLNRGWNLRGGWTDRKELIHETDGCPRTYGYYDIDEIIAIVTALGELVMNNDVHKMTYEHLKERWLRDLEIGIGYRVYEEYKHLYDADADFSAEKMEEWRIKHIIDRFNRASEMALTLWDNPSDVLKVTMTKAFIIFYKREGNECASYKYPPLHQLKKDTEFIKAVTDCLVESCQYDEGDMNNWVSSDNDFPPFPLSVIFHSDYQNYDFEEYTR